MTISSFLGGSLDVDSAGTVQFSESLQQQLLLLIGGESKSLDGLGSMGGSLLDSLSGSVEVSCSVGVLGNSVGLVVILVRHAQNVLSVEGLIGTGLLDSESDGVIQSES